MTRRARFFAAPVVLATSLALPGWARSAERDTAAAAGAAPATPGPAHVRVEALFGVSAPSDGPFPADRFTIVDPTQNTCELVNLPKPDDCGVEHNECVEIDQVNELDGFNPRTRIFVPFSAPVDLETLNGPTIFLLDLGDAMTGGVPSCLLPPPTDCGAGDGGCALPADAGRIVGINQRVWDPETNTLYAEADELLRQHTRYALVVTRGVHDPAGNEVAASQAFKRAISDDPDDTGTLDPDVAAYYATLRRAVAQAESAGIHRHDIVAASVFTTVSVTAVMEKLRDYVRNSPVPAARFDLGLATDGITPVVTVFDTSTITKVVHNRQTKVSGALSPLDITANRFAILHVVPNAPDAVSRIVFGKYQTPYFLDPKARMASVATYSGTPTSTRKRPDGSDDPIDIYFNVFVPAGPKPAGGWPVVVYSYGSGDSKDNSPYLVAADLAAHGLATLAINTVGHGLGPKSTLSITRTSPPLGQAGTMTFPTGGRAVDVNGDGTYGSIEGSQATDDLRFVVQNRDGIRQNFADYVQLVRVIQAGMDWDGDRQRDLDPGRIYAFGYSLTSGAILSLLALEPAVRGVVVGGIGSGPVPQLSPANRPNLGQFFATRQPPLINPPGTPVITSLGGLAVQGPYFNENLPERDQPVLPNIVAGALPIQAYIERAEWVQATTSPATYAPYVRAAPLAGIPTRPFLVLLMRGDQQVPNPSTAELVRMGRFADRVTMYRHDLFSPQNLLFPNPHLVPVLTDPSLAPGANGAFVPLALDLQDEIGTFFESDGVTAKDPDGAGALFEVPASSIPTDFGFVH